MKKDEGSERVNNLPKVTDPVNGIIKLKALVELKARDCNPYISLNYIIYLEYTSSMFQFESIHQRLTFSF